MENISQPNSDETPLQSQDNDSLLNKLRKEMKQAATRLDFERAANLRDRIFQLENDNFN